MLEALILGIVQGLTEFLPISSSGHLILIPYIFNWEYNGLSFDVALHAGTAFALLAFFWRDWLLIIKNAFVKSAAGEEQAGYPKNLFWQIIIASVPAAIAGLLIEDYVESIFHSVLLLSFNLAFFGWLLWFVDKKSENSLKTNDITFKKSFMIGLFQAAALIPGISRSGITITASRLAGLDREAAARFSFLLATPVICGAFVLKIPEILQAKLELSFLLGVAASMIFGFAAIKILLIYLKKSDFSLFFRYRFFLAILAASVYFFRVF